MTNTTKLSIVPSEFAAQRSQGRQRTATSRRSDPDANRGSSTYRIDRKGCQRTLLHRAGPPRSGNCSSRRPGQDRPHIDGHRLRNGASVQPTAARWIAFVRLASEIVDTPEVFRREVLPLIGGESSGRDSRVSSASSAARSCGANGCRSPGGGSRWRRFAERLTQEAGAYSGPRRSRRRPDRGGTTDAAPSMSTICFSILATKVRASGEYVDVAIYRHLRA